MTALGVAPIAVAWLLATPALTLAHGGNQAPPPTDVLGIVLAWHLDSTVIIGLVAGAGLYLGAVRDVNQGHPTNRWQPRRTAAFCGGLIAVALALLSPIDTLSDDLLSVHMVQHLLLVSVAAPLFAASGIGTLALRTASPTARRRYLLPFLHSRIVSALTFPVVGWVAFAGVMWGSHFSSLYNAALLDEGIHAIEHLLYMAAASLFWWPLLSPDPLRWRLRPLAKIGALIAQMPPMSFLAVTIVGASAPLYGAYLGRSDAFGVDALSDQRLAGSLMWILGDFSFLIPIVFLFGLLVRADEAEAARMDAQLDRARALRTTGSPDR